MTNAGATASFCDLIASNNFVSEGNPNATPIGVDPIKSRRRLVSPGRKQKHARVAKKIAREHGELVKAAHLLESALAGACPGRGQDWRKEVQAALGSAIKTLKAHGRSAENDGGIIAEAEAVIGRPPEITEIINQHKNMARKADRLFVELSNGDLPIECRKIRRRGWHIASSLHHHRALEADLIMDAFHLDIGGQG